MVLLKEWQAKTGDELRELWWELRAKVDGPENDHRTTASGSHSLDSWFDDMENIERRLREMGEQVPMPPSESYLMAIMDGGYARA